MKHPKQATQKGHLHIYGDLPKHAGINCKVLSLGKKKKRQRPRPREVQNTFLVKKPRCHFGWEMKDIETDGRGSNSEGKLRRGGKASRKA